MQSVCSEVRFCERSRVKRSFWKLGLSLLVKVSCKRSFWKLGFSLLMKVSCKRSFWKLGLSLLMKVSWKTLVLEAWIVTFGESLV